MLHERTDRPEDFDLARTWASTVAAVEDRHVLIELAAAMPEVIAEQLAGWGARVEVLSPGVVREHMARIGAELTGLYGDGRPATDPTSPSSRRSEPVS